jgi:hypothetical protein
MNEPTIGPGARKWVTILKDINRVIVKSKQSGLSHLSSKDTTEQYLHLMIHTGKGLKNKKQTNVNHPNKRVNIPFGKYNLDKTKLNSNILSFAMKNNNHSVTNLPASKISDKFKAVIMEMMNDMPVNLNKLNTQEVKLLDYIVKASKHPFKNKISNNNEELCNRMELLVGEIRAGNSSKMLKQELSQTMNSLHKAGLITTAALKTYTTKYIMNNY